MRAIVLADGSVPDRAGLEAAWPGWRDGADLVVAADGGARLAAPLGLRINRWVGDGDSIDPAELARLRAAGVTIDRVPVDKDASDTELALLVALSDGASDLTIVGALGGPRLDHALANIGLLAHPALAELPVRILDVAARVSLIRAPERGGGPARVELRGRVGDIVSLLVMGADVEGVTTAGLRYPLRDEPLPAGTVRGLSNVRTADVAAVTVRWGRLLVIEAPATLWR